MIISYAQNAEDVFLNRIFSKPIGFYIDVGACHPTLDSVTKLFYDRGWRGINVEPHLKMHQNLTRLRPRDINLNGVITDRDGPVNFYESPDMIPRSTASLEAAKHLAANQVRIEERLVNGFTLKNVCDAYCKTQEIDFLKIDVEGHELEVIQGGDFKQYRPKVVVVECLEMEAPQDWERILFEENYLFAASDGLNRYYARQENKELIKPLQKPVGVYDNYVPYRFAIHFHWIQKALTDAMDSSNIRTSVKNLSDVIQMFDENSELFREVPHAMYSKVRKRLQSMESP